MERTQRVSFWNLQQRLPRLFPNVMLGLTRRSTLLGLVGLIALVMARQPAVAYPNSSQPVVLKQGQLQALPTLQTRARPLLRSTEPFYLGMLERRFLAYAIENNWQTLSVTRDPPRWVRWQLLPGGEAIYPALVENTQDPPVYARGFVIQAYFQSDRLVALQLILNPNEAGFNVDQLRRLVRGWFPDNRLLLRYQVLPEDPSQQVISAYLGEVPPGFASDIGRTPLPFCHAFLTPTSPTPLLLPGLEVPPGCIDGQGSPALPISAAWERAQ